MEFEWDWVSRSKGLLRSRMTVLTACDTAYLPYAKALLRSIDHFSPGHDVILLVVDPDEDVVAELSRLPKDLPATAVSLVVDRSPAVRSMDPDERRAYYASVRFLFAKTLLAEARGPVMCMDADSLVVAPLKASPALESGADVALWRRDDASRPDHLQVAAGVVVFYPTAGARDFADRLGTVLADKFQSGEGRWYVDQSALHQVMKEFGDQVRVSDLHRKFKDFETFSATSAVWSAKGDRKEFSEPFVSLVRIFGDSELERIRAKHVVNRAARRAPGSKVDKFYRMHPALLDRLPRSGTIYLPRIDLPWKPYTAAHPPVPGDATLDARLRWKSFTSHLAGRLEARGVRMEVQEIPAWEITPERVNATSGDFAVIAHRCDFEMSGLDLPVAYYMQEYLPWLFTLDGKGWGAGSSAYPVLGKQLADVGSGAFGHYRAQLDQGTLGTKFPQAPARERDGRGPRFPWLRRRSAASARDYDIFIPIQVPHDQVIRYFSEVGQAEVLEAVATFARRRALRVVLKPHPANPKATGPFESLVDNEHVFWSEAHIHDLIRCSRTVFTINSSVGFESMLHGKPVVSFGRTPYDAVTIRARLDDLDSAWAQCLEWAASGGEAQYQAFYGWYCDRYAVDLSRPDIRDRSLDRHVGQLIERVYGP